MENTDYNLDTEKILTKRKRNANLYLSNKYSKYRNSLVFLLIMSVASLISSVLGLVDVFKDHESYFFTFTQAIVFLFSIIVSISTVIEMSKIKKNIGQIYHSVDALIEVEKKIEHDNMVDEKILQEQKEIERLQKSIQEHNYKLEHPKCPTCGGHNTRRITTLNRVISVSAIGLASNKIGKTFECLDCKYKW